MTFSFWHFLSVLNSILMDNRVRRFMYRYRLLFVVLLCNGLLLPLSGNPDFVSYAMGSGGDAGHSSSPDAPVVSIGAPVAFIDTPIAFIDTPIPKVPRQGLDTDLPVAVSDRRGSVMDTLEVSLDEIRILAARDTETRDGAPFSVSVHNRSVTLQQLEPGFSMDRITDAIPGLWVNDRQNYALGERITIRGMGWRTAFGVRGIYVLMDDVPLTMPDGQTVMDVVDPSMVRQLEVMRGPGSSFWGNAGGGTMVLTTRPADYDNSAAVRFYGGAFGTLNTSARTAYRSGNSGYAINTSWFQREGYRNHSHHSAFRMTAHMEKDLSSGRHLRVSGAFVDAPDTRHPGSLTREELNDDRRRAAVLFERVSAGKQWRHGQLGAGLGSETASGRWQATVYGIARSLHNPLPFADIEVNRLVGGSRIAWYNRQEHLRWGFGADAAWQSDSRRNYSYRDGFIRDDRVLDQRETVWNGAVFARVATGWRSMNISGGVRADALRFASDDRLMAGGEDQSGERFFTAASPSVSISRESRYGLMYLSFGTSFETPTTTELVNRPDMTGGFNQDLSPERSRGLEAGLRGGLESWRLRYDMALFRQMVRDQLVSYRTEDGEGRDFYRNAGRTRHDGLEVRLQWKALKWLDMTASYQRSLFEFRESVDTGLVRFTRGNRLPGIPDHRLRFILNAETGPFLSILTVELVDRYYVDNANTAYNPGYHVVDLQFAHAGLTLFRELTLMPFATVRNITDVRYNSSVSINATGGRYYEPAPGRAFYAGFTLAM